MSAPPRHGDYGLLNDSNLSARPGEADPLHGGSPPLTLARGRPRWLVSPLVSYAAVLVLGAGLGYWADDRRNGAGSAFYNEATSHDCDRYLGKTSWTGARRTAGEYLCTEHSTPANWTGVQRPDAQLRFFILGDWGRDGFCCQNDVAVEIATAAEAAEGGKPLFIVNTGDSFYPAGITSESSQQWDTSWRNVYLHRKAMDGIPWWGVLGNHDYKGETKPQLTFGNVEERWVMPAKQWVREVELDAAGHKAVFVMIDTNPLFYGAGPDELEFFGYGKDDSEKNLKWLEDQLSKANADWLFVVGHHPVISRGSHVGEEFTNFKTMQEELKPILEQHKVDAYICGHDHDMQHLRDSDVNYFISGAGSQVKDLHNSADLQHTTAGLFGIGRQGFAVVNVMDASNLHLQFIDYKGSVVYQAEVSK